MGRIRTISEMEDSMARDLTTMTDTAEEAFFMGVSLTTMALAGALEGPGRRDREFMIEILKECSEILAGFGKYLETVKFADKPKTKKEPKS